MNLENTDLTANGFSLGAPSVMVPPSYYELLNIDSSATRLMIREAYLRLKSLYTNGSDGLYGMTGAADLNRHLREIEEAFEVLNDENRRAQYDRTILGNVTPSTISEWNPEADVWKPLPTTPSQDVIQTSRSTLKVTRTHANGSLKEELQSRFAALLADVDIGDGSTLVKLREIAGVSIEEMQERTKIALEYIRGMENNQFNRLPQVVYVKGFMRSYLRYLNIPNLEKIVNAYAARLEAWQSGQKS